MNKEIFAQTDRLVLRKFNRNDYLNLCGILQDEKAMYAYEGAFSDDEVPAWLDNQLRRYREEGVGLYAVELKDGGGCARLHGTHSVYLHRRDFCCGRSRVYHAARRSARRADGGEGTASFAAKAIDIYCR